ncbi:hypothetical protein QKW52_20240 [Bacillus sonorensis]|nr:hypothetical protein [Bacillus sonorensis]
MLNKLLKRNAHRGSHPPENRSDNNGPAERVDILPFLFHDKLSRQSCFIVLSYLKQMVVNREFSESREWGSFLLQEAAGKE